MRTIKDLSGERFGGLIVVERAPKRGAGHDTFWHCRCDKGHDVVVTSGSLRRIGDRGGFGCGECVAVPRDKIDGIKSDYASGMKPRDVAARHGVDHSTVIEIVRRSGAHVRNASESRRRYDCDHHYFDTIDTEAKAYWLGFLAADGCVKEGNRVALVLAEADRGHVEKFRSAIGSTHPIRESISHAFGGHWPAVGVSVRSPEMTAALFRLGIGLRKSLTFDPPTLRPDLMRHFWRGMIDGDGCIARNASTGAWTVSLCGSEQSVRSFALFASGICHTRAMPRSIGSIFEVRFGSSVALAVIRALYDNAAVQLDRKHALYIQAVSMRCGVRGRGRLGPGAAA